MGVLVKFGDVESPMYEFREDKILSISTDTAINLIGEQLKIDTMTPLVRFMVVHPEPLIDSEGVPLVDANGVPLIGYGTGDLRLLPHGTKATLYTTAGDEEFIKAVYYVDDVERVAKDQYQINCMSIIGRLEEQRWVGRFFYNNMRLYQVLDLILGESINYQISVFLTNRLLYGYIPNGTKREALYHLMLALGMGIDTYEETIIFRPVGVGNAGVIPDDRIYINGKVIYPKPPSSVQVIAHYWEYMSPNSAYEDRVVWDNTQSLEPANNDIVEVDFVYTGYTIEFVDGEEHLYTDLQEDVDFARNSLGRFTIKSGIGKLTLQCPPRVDTVIEVTNPEADVNRVVSVTDELMISPYNAQNVANRLMDYYKNAKVIETSIILDREKCGNIYDFNNVFGESETAAITSMLTTYSNITKADCRLISGVSTSYDFPYSDYIKYESSQVIDLRPLKELGVTSIAVLLIGGGQAGFDGEDGNSASNEPGNDFIRRGGKGGKGGKAGKGGASKLVEIDITGVDEITLTCGDGGTENGEIGGVTSIEYTDTSGLFPLAVVEDTQDGEVFNVGTLNPLSGETYGESGDDGISGGNGGDSGRIFAAKILYPDWTYSNNATDADGFPIDISETVSAQSGERAKIVNSTLRESFPTGGQPSKGNYGTNLIMYYGSTDTFDVYYSFGGAAGGGAAYIERGEDGEAIYG